MIMTAFCEGRSWMSALETVPKKYNAMVRLRLPRDVKRGIARLAKDRKVAASDLYRQAIDDFLREQRSVQNLTGDAARLSLDAQTKSA